ncbi:hypothetical protein [Bdellovibrio sp.]|uniref:hypothetical protein n=1 Tax=Bdellovibrio sp. TaxID=28201 RepID=UPI0039E70657
MKKVKLLFKTLLSLWIVYNIFTMMVMPNVGAYFGRTTSRFIVPYANSIGLNASWNFFSPDPAHTMYIRYLIRYQDPEGNEVKEPIEGFFPAEKNKGVLSGERKRELYVMRFMVIDPKRLRLLFGPWLCRQYPGATSVEMEHVVETVPTLDQVVTLKDEAVQDLSRELQVTRESTSCVGGTDEEAL